MRTYFGMDELNNDSNFEVSPYYEFLRAGAMSAGIYKLKAGSEDLQQPHTEDEIYHVIQGQSKFYMAGKDIDVQAGSILYVPANVDHRFHSITDDLTILVIFAPAEYSQRPTQSTTIFMVRHAESPYTHGAERTRGLSEQGILMANKVADILNQEHIDKVISSPYARAILTVEELARQRNLNVELFEDLRERHFAGDDYHIPDSEFDSSVSSMFADTDYALPGGESNSICQKRAVRALKQILTEHRGKSIAVGTHGNVMTLMMNYFDPQYGREFLKQTSKPDIYRLQFDGMSLAEVTRLWSE